MNKAEKPLERLVSCGRCGCSNVKEYAEQLRNLAAQKANREEAKKRGRFFKAFGDETRQRMLSLLVEREMCVCELTTALEMTQPTTSHHLKILEDAGVIQSVKDGTWVFYSVKDKQRIASLIEAASE